MIDHLRIVGFCALGVLGFAILAGRWILDRRWKQGYAKGLEDGKAKAEQEAFLRGVMWTVDAEKGIDRERFKLWKGEIGA